MNKVSRCAVVVRRQVYESSFWTSKEVYETSHRCRRAQVATGNGAQNSLTEIIYD